MTVSRVLAGGKNVRADKIERVLQAVTALGYRKNENARSLRPGQSTGLIGVVITNVSNPYYAEVQHGIDEVVSERGFRLLVGDSNESVERESRLVADFVGRQVDGLIVVAAGGSADHLLPQALPNTPLVLASRPVPGISADTVVIDDVQGTAEAISELIQRGHRRIAFVGNLVTVSTSQRRLEGFMKAHNEAGIAVDDALIRGGQHDPEEARAVTRELLALDEPPTAIFAANNRKAVGVIRAIAEHQGGRLWTGRAAPHVVSFDNFEFSDLMPFHLSIIDHDARELGRAAARMLTNRLEEKPDAARAPQLVQLPTTLRHLGDRTPEESTTRDAHRN